MLDEENSYFRAVVNDAVDDILEKGTAYCFQQEQVDVIKKILKEKHKIDTLYVKIVDGIFYVSKYKEMILVGN